MTTYNGGKYLDNQIKSILNQTLLPDEIVIFDDCSSDGTNLILKEYVQKYPLIIKMVRNTTNVGYKRNFFDAIKFCTGDYIFLCDQDDVWEDDKIAAMVSLMRDNPEIFVLNSALRLIDSNGKQIKTKQDKGKTNVNLINKSIEYGSLWNVTYDYLIKGNISAGCTICFRKEIKKLFVKSYDFIWPHDLCINMIGVLINGLFFYNIPLTNYRIHENNTIGFTFQTSKNKNKITDKIRKIRSNARCEYRIARRIPKEMADIGIVKMVILRYQAFVRCSMIDILKLFLNKSYIKNVGIKKKMEDLVVCIWGRLFIKSKKH